jgi:SAM-dependent methyltransferase
MRRFNPEMRLTGVDARWQQREANGFELVHGNAMDADLYAPARFDVIVLLGALEHFGLGFYGDPTDEDGDTRTMQNVARWLKPGGWVYFDVPCNPTYRVTENRHFRVYSPAAVGQRLIVPGLREVSRGYSDCEPRAGAWMEEPTVEKVPYHFVAVLAVL